MLIGINELEASPEWSDCHLCLSLSHAIHLTPVHLVFQTEVSVLSNGDEHCRREADILLSHLSFTCPIIYPSRRLPSYTYIAYRLPHLHRVVCVSPHSADRSAPSFAPTPASADGSARCAVAAVVRCTALKRLAAYYY